MKAEVAVGVVLSALLEHPDLIIANEHDAAVAIGEFRGLCDKLFGHVILSLSSASRTPGGPSFPNTTDRLLDRFLDGNLPALGCESN
jgi:hypothetical protein